MKNNDFKSFDDFTIKNLFEEFFKFYNNYI